MSATGRAIGFDIGGTHARACVVQDDGVVAKHGPVVKERWRDDGPATPDRLADALLRLAERVGGVSIAELAVGIGIAAQLDRDGRTVVNAPNLGWRDLPLADLLSERLGSRPVLVNDVNAILLGELHFGAAVGARDVLAVYWGTGIGGALAVDGRLVTGASGSAGEIGHVKVPGFAGRCGCGEAGCIEALAGGAALLDRIAASSLADRAHGVDDLERLAVGGDREAVAFLDEIVDGVAHVVSGACTLLSPEILLLGGGVLERAPSLLERLASRTSTLTLGVSRAPLRAVRGALGDVAGPLGAGAHALRALH